MIHSEFIALAFTLVLMKSNFGTYLKYDVRIASNKLIFKPLK